jgi:hypothetical protein
MNRMGKKGISRTAQTIDRARNGKIDELIGTLFDDRRGKYIVLLQEVPKIVLGGELKLAGESRG